MALNCCSEIQDLPAPSSNIDQDKIGHVSRKKHSRLRTEENDDQTNTELMRKKKVKKSNTETGDDSSSSDHSCFVALVTASNLHKDALYLPQELTSSVGLKRSCSEIVVTDESERSWTLDLRFSKSSDTFYISRGWRSFCDENGKKAGGIIVLKLVGDEAMPILSFCSTESINDGTKGDKNNKENCMELERKKKRLRCRDSTSPRQNRFVTLTLPDDRSKTKRLYLPASFRREIGINKPGMITMLGKYGRKSLVNLRWDSVESMCFGRGLKDFAEANGLRSGESFTLEVIFENGTPMLSLFSTQSINDRIQQGECSKDSRKESINDETKAHTNNKGNCMELFRCRDLSSPSLDRKQQVECSKDSKRESFSPEPSSGKRTGKAKKNKVVRRDSIPKCFNRFVTLTVTHDNLRSCRKKLPLSFTRENGLDKPGMIILVGKDGTKWGANLGREKNRIMCLRKGWKDFAIANGLKCGESFTLETNWENGTPTLRLFSTESTSDKKQQGECSKDSERELISTEPSSGNKVRKDTNNGEERRDSTSAIQSRFVTLSLTPEDVRAGKLILPSQFMKANGISKLGKITLLGNNRMKWFAYILSKDGLVALGCGWKGFCEANGVKTGESFTLECVHEQDTTPVFKFCSKAVRVE